MKTTMTCLQCHTPNCELIGWRCTICGADYSKNTVEYFLAHVPTITDSELIDALTEGEP